MSPWPKDVGVKIYYTLHTSMKSMPVKWSEKIFTQCRNIKRHLEHKRLSTEYFKVKFPAECHHISGDPLHLLLATLRGGYGDMEMKFPFNHPIFRLKHSKKF